MSLGFRSIVIQDYPSLFLSMCLFPYTCWSSRPTEVSPVPFPLPAGRGRSGCCALPIPHRRAIPHCAVGAGGPHTSGSGACGTLPADAGGPSPRHDHGAQVGVGVEGVISATISRRHCHNEYIFETKSFISPNQVFSNTSFSFGAFYRHRHSGGTWAYLCKKIPAVATKIPGVDLFNMKASVFLLHFCLSPSHLPPPTLPTSSSR